MPKITKRLPSFEGVAAGATATLRMPIGNTYEKLLVSYSGVTLAQMKEVRLVGNGKTIRRYVGAALVDAINQFDRQNAAAGLLTLNLSRPGLITKAGREDTLLGTGVTPSKDFPVTLTTLQLEIDIDAAAAGPVLSCKAVLSAPRPLDKVLKVRRFGYAPSASGEFEIADLPRGDLINRMVFESANIDAIRIERDNRVIFERTKAENEDIQSNGVRTPQAGYFVYDPTEEGYGSEPMVTAGVQDLRIILTMAAADQVPVNVEYIGRMER